MGVETNKDIELNEAYGVDVNKLMHLVKHGVLPQDPPGKGAQSGLHTFQEIPQEILPEDLPGEPSPSPLPRGEGPGVGTSLEGILPTAKLLHADQANLTGQSDRFKWDDCPDRGYAGWRFPGQCDPYPTCGKYYTIGCLEHSPGYAKRVKHDCGRAGCPICYKTWLVKATRKATERLEAGKPRPYSKATHITTSPPRHLWHLFETKEGVRKLRRKHTEILKKAGLSGGMTVPHPYRGNAKQGWYKAPHFHTVCYGWVRHYDKIKGILGGWILKNHRIRKSIGATVYYQLSHAGVRDGLHVVSWYGSLAWNKLQKIPDPPAEPETCPICGGPLTRVIFYGTGPNPFQGDTEELDNLHTWEWRYER